MAEEKKTYMPQSGAGLIRYYDADEKGAKISPYLIVGAAAGFSAFVVVLNLLG